MADQSRHGNYSSRKIPYTKTSKKLYGEKDDTDKYYKCKICGFICDIDRDARGDDGSQYPLAFGEYTATQDGVTDATDLRNPVTYSIVNSGCPFCGSRNWK